MKHDNGQKGPIKERDIQVLWKTRDINQDTYVWRKGLKDVHFYKNNLVENHSRGRRRSLRPFAGHGRRIHDDLTKTERYSIN